MCTAFVIQDPKVLLRNKNVLLELQSNYPDQIATVATGKTPCRAGLRDFHFLAISTVKIAGCNTPTTAIFDWEILSKFIRDVCASIEPQSGVFDVVFVKDKKI